jgi:hypothetical protein
MSQEDFDDDFEERHVRQCSTSCGHFDELNLCCWVASNRGLCTEVSEGDYCLYGFLEDSWE